jgi:hypothetical protein
MASPIYPTGYSGSALVSQIQIRTNEFNTPNDAQVIQLANAGIEQVAAELGAIRLIDAYPTTTGQVYITLNEYIADIYSANFSTGPIGQSSPPVTVYPMTQLDQASFMDAAAGFPGVGAGPPQFYLLAQDSANIITMQLYPPGMIGQVNVYYRGRPQLWADATINSSTNLDTQAQEAVVLWTCCRVLEAVQRGDESKDIFQPQYDAQIQKLKESIARRSVPKSGQVRDVRAISYPGWPIWW